MDMKAIGETAVHKPTSGIPPSDSCYVAFEPFMESGWAGWRRERKAAGFLRTCQTL